MKLKNWKLFKKNFLFILILGMGLKVLSKFLVYLELGKRKKENPLINKNLFLQELKQVSHQ